MDLHLEPAEARVIGALIEKEITTPEYYPLSLNALVNACNQKSNRDPVVDYDEELVDSVLESLRHKGLLTTVTGAGSRVPKYGHRLTDQLNLGRREIAILCELMLRGPQTSGELRNRTERMHRFDDIAEIESVLDRMQELVMKLPRRPGEKEGRYAHLLSGEPALEAAEEPQPVRQDRVTALEAEMAQLRQEFEALKEQFAEFRRQFE
ncbi:MAG TPA: YceH family protein [Bryobacteraceae bacterium]|nr:YceH family protein [Bryobacteraceae bacterium]